MTEVLPFVVTGIVTGSLYGLGGLGLVLTYRTSGVFNFGHGAIAAGAAYLFYSLHFTHGLPWPVASLITLAAFGVVVGWVMERITRGLGDVPEAVVVVATVGIFLGVQGLLFILYGAPTRSFPDFLPTSGITLSGVNVSWAQMISLGIATTVAVVLYVFLRTSRLGVAMRAVVDNPTLTALSGEVPARIRRASWTIGTAFAGLTGILLAPTLGLDATLLSLLVVQAFGACSIGLFQNLPLTYAGGIAVGVAASLATKYFTSGALQGLPPSVPFLVLFGMLLVVPTARLPRRRASLRSLIPETKPMAPKTAALAVSFGGLALVLIPSVAGTRLPVWNAALVNVIVFASLALLVWVSGQISLAHASFLAVGATTMAHLAGGGMPWGLALLLAGLATVPVGAAVALPAIRLSGLYLALATLGFAVFMQNVVYPTSWMFSSSLTVSVSRPQFGAFDGASNTSFYYLVLVIAGVSCAAMAAIRRGQLGRLLRALSETPTMLQTNGLAVNMTRLIVFCISAFFAGIAGALLVTQFGSASGVSFGPINSLVLLAVLSICGTRPLRSSVLAAGLLSVVPGYLDGFNAERQLLTFGVAAVAAGIVLNKRIEIAAWLARATRPVSDEERLERARLAAVRLLGTHREVGQHG